MLFERFGLLSWQNLHYSLRKAACLTAACIGCSSAQVLLESSRRAHRIAINLSAHEQMPVCVLQPLPRLCLEKLETPPNHEARTHDDAIAFSFHDPLDGVRFVSDLQQALLRLPWPAELLQRPEAAVISAPGPHGATVIFAGLRLRAVLHIGWPTKIEVSQPCPVLLYYAENFAQQLQPPPGESDRCGCTSSQQSHVSMHRPIVCPVSHAWSLPVAEGAALQSAVCQVPALPPIWGALQLSCWACGLSE